MKIKILISVIANIEGKSVPLTAGQVIDAPNEAAGNLINGGYAERTDAPRTAVTKRPRGKAR